MKETTPENRENANHVFLQVADTSQLGRLCLTGLKNDVRDVLKKLSVKKPQKFYTEVLFP